MKRAIVLAGLILGMLAAPPLLLAAPGLHFVQDGESASMNMCDATFAHCAFVAVQRVVDPVADLRA